MRARSSTTGSNRSDAVTSSPRASRRTQFGARAVRDLVHRGRTEGGGDVEARRLGDRPDVVVRHQRRILGEFGQAQHRLEGVQAREAHRRNRDDAGGRRQRRPELRGAEGKAPVVVADRLADQERRAPQQLVHPHGIVGRQLVHRRHPHRREDVGGDDQAERLGLAVADDQAVTGGQRSVSVEGGVVGAARYHRFAVVRKALHPRRLAAHDVNVSVGVIVVPTAPLHCDVPGDAVHAPSRTPAREEEKIVASTVPPVRVAAVPSGHPYVTAVADPTHVTLLADPPPPGAPAGRWWPPQILLPEWLRDNAADFDLVHVHFGIESYTPRSSPRPSPRCAR